MFNNYVGVKNWFKDGNTLEPDSKAITYAACFDHDKITLFLADKGLSLETRDMYGRTPIEWAAFYSNHSLITLLLSRGAKTAGNSWLSHPALLHYILRNTWNVAGEIPKLEEHIDSANTLKILFDRNSSVIFDKHSQTTEKDLTMLDRVENGLCGKPLLEEMERFINS